MKKITANDPCTSNVWDCVFRGLGSFDEQTIASFIGMVVEGQLQMPAPGIAMC